MAKRRGNHEGTIFKRDNGTWRAQLSLNGHRLSYTGKTQQECHEWVKQTHRKIDAGRALPGALKPLDEFLSGWLVSIKSSIQPSTWHLYRQIIRDHILPDLGQVKLRDLRPEHIQSLYDSKLESGASPRTVQSIHTVLHCTLGQAVKLGMLSRNPDDVTTPPKRVHKEMSIYDEAQVGTLILAARTQRERYLAIYQLAITTGMRMGELLGLKWTDLDWERRGLQVQRQLRMKRGGGYEFTRPKTKAGMRALRLGDAMLENLRQHQKRQLNDIQIAGNRWHALDLIFPSTIGKPLDGSYLRKAFKQLIRQAGLPNIRFHDLRHTAASLMLNYGVPVIVVSRRLGHARPSMTLDVYGHLIPSMQEEVAEVMDTLITT